MHNVGFADELQVPAHAAVRKVALAGFFIYIDGKLGFLSARFFERFGQSASQLFASLGERYDGEHLTANRSLRQEELVGRLDRLIGETRTVCRSTKVERLRLNLHRERLVSRLSKIRGTHTANGLCLKPFNRTVPCFGFVKGVAASRLNSIAHVAQAFTARKRCDQGNAQEHCRAFARLSLQTEAALNVVVCHIFHPHPFQLKEVAD